LSTGKLIYKGDLTCTFNNNGFPQIIKEGRGFEYHASGEYYEGNFVQDKKCGKGMLYNSDNVAVYSGDWENGARNGHGTYLLYLNGNLVSRYQGNFIDELYDGFGKETFPNGDQYEGLYQVGKKHGKGIMKLKDEQGVIISGNWTEGYMQGSIHYIDKATNQIVKTVLTDQKDVTTCKKTPKRASVSTRATTKKPCSESNELDINSVENSMYEIHKTRKNPELLKLNKEIDRRVDEFNQNLRTSTTSRLPTENTSKFSKSPQTSKSTNKKTPKRETKSVNISLVKNVKEKRNVFTKKEDPNEIFSTKNEIFSTKNKEKSVKKPKLLIVETDPLSIPIKKKPIGVASTIRMKKDKVVNNKSKRIGV